MRRMLLMTAVALGAPSAWAQDVVLPEAGDGYSVEERFETAKAEGEGGQDEGGYDDDADDDSEDGGDDADKPEKTERADRRSETGSDRGGQRGSVSIMARSGLGPVFGALRSQGYGGFEIAEVDGEIRVTASRRGEVRDLTYDASTGKILSDVSETADGGVTETIANSLGKADTKTKRGRDADSPRGGDGKSEAGGKSGGGGSKGVGAGANASSGKSGKSSGKSAGGGKSGKSSGGGSKGGGKSSSGKGGGKSGGNGKGNGKNK